ncbi:TIGR03013 family XrtA/PEP-CTERM system glycosyltransferase [Kordiimonas sp. SCSIO 12610]|uniref:TIGR03013 family XrtA/PEP-CTERM system glycosyltransferase n=1 Tax=Kordiimonas sp. SCSIO 12610 TaxID=2829597 RepID=UPI00210A05AA|nr:TIGR03013 family XrtA/PEP-CTERM system glycosyltransferase [Kordiimonas sp. SCSIO 12610]UTW54162.1 TIGR03013 family PEP-CTERM/XrtA system glycosyltransferase [Kordiimonas sp. SCSIO 12610]
MVRLFRHYISPVKLGLAIGDVAVLTASIFLAEWLRLSALDIDLLVGTEALVAKLLFPLIIVPVMFSVGCYHSDSVRASKVFFIRLFISFAVSSLLLFATAYLFPFLPLWRSILILALFIGAVGVFIGHLFFLKVLWQRRWNRRVIILGAGSKAKYINDYIASAREAGLRVVAVCQIPGEAVKIDSAVSIDNFSQFDKFALTERAELIIVANDDADSRLPMEAMIACKLQGIEVQEFSTFNERVRGYVKLESLSAEWIIYSEGFKGTNDIELIGKRILDMLASSILLVLTFPIILLTAILVKLTSRGPALYRQERIGQFGERFELLKFRSMIVNAENANAPKWAEEKDPRITTIGRFIRMTRIDELPQLVNVLRGQMSFVGPRPERPYFVEKIGSEVPFYRERHYVKPGLTGWAQIQYPYGASIDDARRKLEFDLYYIKNYSLVFDLLIILQTVRVVLFPSGAR